MDSQLATKLCKVCGSNRAPFGLGPPLRAKTEWYCADHYEMTEQKITDNINEIQKAGDGK